ncbi:MAG: type I-MYXAN CRISPR-associated Cas8a1/Cmx1, partial [Crocosphaera sp.]|nr:type I-MYXAN CRISPR-associated Cas8a1/Cmx1 [Crocosphaera sp.]
LVIPEQFYLLLKGKPNPQTSINFQVYDVKISLYYKHLNSYIHQNFSHKLCHPKTHKLIEGHIPIVSWLYPGAIVRHEKIKKNNQCQEPTKYAFVLLFLPIACHYLILSKVITEQIKSQTHPIKYLLVIPDPINLEESAQIRWRLNNTKYENLYVSSLGEAAFSYYAKEITNNFSPQRCQVIVYGKLLKDSWLRSPTDCQDFKINKKTIQSYQLAYRNFQPNRLLQTPKGFLVRINLIRDFILNNLINTKQIWSNLWLTLKQKDKYG